MSKPNDLVQGTLDQQEGWIKAEWQQTENNRRAKVYSLTRLGKRQLEAEAANWHRLSSALSHVSLRTFQARHLSDRIHTPRHNHWRQRLRDLQVRPRHTQQVPSTRISFARHAYVRGILAPGTPDAPPYRLPARPPAPA